MPFFFVMKVFMRSWHGVDIFFCGTTETSFEQMVNMIFRLFVKLNALCRYNDNELVSRPQDRQPSKPFVHAKVCFKIKEAVPKEKQEFHGKTCRT